MSTADISAIQNEQNGIRKSLTTIAFETEFNSRPLFRKTQEYPLTVGTDTTSIIVTLPALVRSTFTYENASFETDAVGSTEITGWTPITDVVNFGAYQIGGSVTPIDTPPVGSDQNTPENAGIMTVTVTDEEASNGDNSLRLTSRNHNSVRFDTFEDLQSSVMKSLVWVLMQKYPLTGGQRVALTRTTHMPTFSMSQLAKRLKSSIAQGPLLGRKRSGLQLR